MAAGTAAVDHVEGHLTPATGPAGRGAGLSADQVAERVAAGLTNHVDARTSRSMAEIVRANVFTFFNGLLLSLFVATVATGRWQNALFGFVIVANAGIGIQQELRAKHALDRMALLNAPIVRVIRDGASRPIDPAEVVIDDLVELAAGDQVVADGLLLTSGSIEVDESLLSGEAEPVARAEGEELRSGTLIVAGDGCYRVTAVGDSAYAARLARDARRFALTRSELVEATNRLLRVISILMLVISPLLLWSQFHSRDNHGWQDSVTGATAALVGMVPEGLVLLTSVAFVVGIVTLARRGILVQELPAVEGLARVDVICLDKTGTLTCGEVDFQHAETFGGLTNADIAAPLAALAAVPSANATAVALARHFTDASLEVVTRVPFASARKWSGIVTAHGCWLLGAPEVLLATATSPDALAAQRRADELAAAGGRVLLLAHGQARDLGDASPRLPAHLVPAALLVFGERIREDAAETLRYFAAQGVEIKVISGDAANTVGAVAARVGVPGVHSARDAVDARELTDDPVELAEIMERGAAFGRTTPHQKRAMIAALQRNGHVVAMTGDGVNDALALKDADIGVAMGSGSPASRAVAQLVLLDGRFAHLPEAVAEGRRVIANIERAASLFLIKNVYSLTLAIITAAVGVAYPLAPIQLTMISTLSIGVPGFVLALAPNLRRYRPGFLRRALHLAVPAGLAIGSLAFAAFYVTRLLEAGTTIAQARSVATIVVLAASLSVIVAVARPLNGWKTAMVVGLSLIALAVVLIPALGSRVFLIDLSFRRALIGAVAAAGGIAAAQAAIFMFRDRADAP